MDISMEKIKGVFRTYLKKNGMRYTPERETILYQIFSDHTHFDVDDLYLKLRDCNYRISKASIYRLIPLLIDCGLIRQSYTEDGHQHYEHVYGHQHHDHLRCIKCGKVIEFMDETIENAQEKVGKRYGFNILDHQMEIRGYCSDCAKAH